MHMCGLLFVQVRVVDMSRLFHPTLNPPQKTLTPLKGLISLTKEPDCMTYDDDPDVWRAKMPCGHVFGEYCSMHCTCIDGKSKMPK